MRDQKHEFALYFEQLSQNFSKAGKLIILDPELVQRLFKILRLVPGDNLTLFNQNYFVDAQISLIDKKQLVLENLVWHNLATLKPEITVAIGVLKKENFENALYSCVELGANAILPIMFAKSAPTKLNHERVNKILISASEQSKNFSMPVWHEPILFHQFLAQIQKKQAIKTAYIYCDIHGKPMLPIISQIKSQVYEKIVLIVGPEGDLTSEEQAQLAEQHVFSMQLTPTVLRSFQAVTVALGACRSLL